MVDAPRPQVPLSHGNEAEHRRLLAMRANGTLPTDGSQAMAQPLPLWQVAVADLPAVADWAGALIYVTDEAGGPVPAYSDGTNWRRFSDGTIVS